MLKTSSTRGDTNRLAAASPAEAEESEASAHDDVVEEYEYEYVVLPARALIGADDRRRQDAIANELAQLWAATCIVIE